MQISYANLCKNKMVTLGPQSGENTVVINKFLLTKHLHMQISYANLCKCEMVMPGPQPGEIKHSKLKTDTSETSIVIQNSPTNKTFSMRCIDIAS